MAKFIIREGEKVIREYPLEKESLIIGRDKSSDIVLEDLSVSRQHTKIFKEADKLMIEDLGSSNGTFLNGGKIHKSGMKSRDEIGIGKYTLCYQEEEVPVDTEKTALVSDDEEATRVVSPVFPVDAPGPAKSKKSCRLIQGLPAVLSKPAILITAGVVVLIIIVSLISSLFNPPAKTSAPQPGQKTLSALLNEGAQLYKSQKWAEAVAKFDEAAKLAPQDQTVQEYLSKSRQAYYFTDGLADFKASKWEGAITKFSQVLAINPDQEQAGEYLAQARTMFKADEYFNQGREYYQSGEWELAIEKFKAALQLQPDHKEARTYLEESEAQLSSTNYFEQGLERFRAGKYIEAIARFKKISPKDKLFKGAQGYITKANHLLQVEQYLKQGNLFYNQGGIQSALVQFNKILEIEKEYPGLKETIEKVEKIEKCYTTAKQLQQEGQVLESVTQWRKILSLETDTNNFFYLEAKQFLKQIEPELSSREEEAKNLYRAGYVLRDMNPEKAVENWKKILQLVPSDNEYYIKAKKMLEKY